MNIDELKRNLSISQVFAENGIRINARGFCKCPFHEGDRSASLKVYESQGTWYCYGCHQHGDQLDFIQKLNHCDRVTAYKLLGGKDDKELTWAEKKKLEIAKERREQYRMVLNDVNQRIAETEYEIAECERGIRLEGILAGTITDNMVEYGSRLTKAERDLDMYTKFKIEWIREYEKHIRIND